MGRTLRSPGPVKYRCQRLIAPDGRLIPGLIDGHAHLTGGGGEAGPATRVPAPVLSHYTVGGVTTVVGVLGTDDVTRTTGDLVAAARGLVAEGLSAWCHSGGYHIAAQHADWNGPRRYRAYRSHYWRG